jgi:6-phosphogluconolactonase (cycloisomerase 2 family)
MRIYKEMVCLGGAMLALTACALAQDRIITNIVPADSLPVAYIYVAHTPKNSSTHEIAGYSASADGRLTPLGGSPFMEDVSSMAVDGKHMVAASRLTPEANVYAIQQDGKLTFMASTDYGKYNSSSDCGDAGQLFFDHTGAYLYIQEFNGSDACSNTVVASFALHKSTGELAYLGTNVTGVFPGDNMAAFFTGNSLYAYSAVNSACMYYDIYGFVRSGNGDLKSLNFTHNLPEPPEGVRGYVPSLAAADPTNHVAFTEQPANPPGCAPGPLQLATYTVDPKGNLTTTSTYENMPATEIEDAYDMKMSPSGRLLAIAGEQGLQVFHFNGAAPITKYTGLLTADAVNQMFWDNNNHLYAISQSSGKLFVFTITPTEAAQAPGSPYSIAGPANIAVQPYPLP